MKSATRHTNLTKQTRGAAAPERRARAEQSREEHMVWHMLGGIMVSISIFHVSEVPYCSVNINTILPPGCRAWDGRGEGRFKPKAGGEGGEWGVLLIQARAVSLHFLGSVSNVASRLASSPGAGPRAGAGAGAGAAAPDRSCSVDWRTNLRNGPGRAGLSSVTAPLAIARAGEGGGGFLS